MTVYLDERLPIITLINYLNMKCNKVHTRRVVSTTHVHEELREKNALLLFRTSVLAQFCFTVALQVTEFIVFFSF